MRSAVILVVTTALLVCGFVAYWMFQPSTPMSGPGGIGGVATPMAATQPTTAPDAGRIAGIGQGERVWLKSFGKDGLLTSQTRAREYIPRKDGTVHVIEPEAEFFLSHQRVRIVGKEGDIVPSEATSRGGVGAAHAEPPNRGLLQDVTITLFDPPDSTEPTLTATMNNAAFDNETFRIYTEAYTDETTGQLVPADRVPVVVRGKDYDFDGQGLILHWNERDRRLESLEIAHGKQLTIKNLSGLGQSTLQMKGSSMSLPPVPVARPMLASTDESSVVETLPANEPATQPSSSVTYRATFFDSVRITQSGQDLATGDRMNVDDLPKSETPPAEPTTSPTSAPASADNSSPTTQPADTAASVAPMPPAPPVSADTAAERPHPHKAAVPTPPPAVAAAPPSAPSAPATQPQQPPIIIYWTGKLQIVPLDGPPIAPLTPGQAAVQIIGSPVHLQRDDNHGQCASLVYETAGSAVSLYDSPQFPVRMEDSRGGWIASQAIRYFRDEHRALLSGVSHAHVPVEGTDPNHPRMVDASWTKSCRLSFAPQSADGDSLSIRQADLLGDVDVDHPQIHIRSNSLQLTFDPRPHTPAAAAAPTTRPTEAPANLRQVIADGNVHSILIDSAGKKQTIDCQRLNVQAALDGQGKTYPHLVTAEGGVHTADDQQELWAEYLDLTLAPIPPSAAAKSPAQNPSDEFSNGSVQVEHLLARQRVRLAAKDGSSAQADQLTMDMQDDHPRIRLLGEPAAKVSDNQSTLTGALIDMSPQQKQASVLGPGTLHAVQQPASGGPPKPMDIAWGSGVTVDGQANRIDVSGKVVLHSLESDGGIDTAKADSMTLALADAPPSPPATQPTTASTVSTGAATQPTQASSLAGQMNFMKDKIVRSISLQDHAQVASTLSDADGALLRRMDLYAQTVNYDVIQKQMVVPTPGRLLFEDRRPDTPQPGQSAGANPSARGATAFQWRDRLTYTEAQHQAVMSGNVVVVHQPIDPAAQPFRMNADRVVAELTEAPTTAPATPPATEPVDAAQRMQLKRILAEGNLTFDSRGIEFQASKVEYDPVTQIVVAHGSDDAPAELFDADGASKGSFTELWWNMKTQQIDRLYNAGAQLRQ